MPYHAKEKKANKKKIMKKKVVKKTKKTKGLSLAQKNKLKEHSKHHTAKHMTMMRNMMKGGVSFAKAHQLAKKVVGK